MKMRIIKSSHPLYICTPLNEKEEYKCRIKGKVLKTSSEYSPLCTGDEVEVELYNESEGLISSRYERHSYFSRYNRKKGLNQVIVSNYDLLLVVLSSVSPPFRPRFVDRVICGNYGSSIALVLNKCDLELKNEEEKRWALYSSLRYKCFKTSCVNNNGIEELKEYIKGKVVALVGQSGVGKSTLINTLTSSNEKVGKLSSKYNRGTHTTTSSSLVFGDGFSLYDTPGFREMAVPSIKKSLIRDSFPELRNLSCLYQDCLHQGEEGCSVDREIESGNIDIDRYYSYLRILDSIDEREASWWKENK